MWARERAALAAVARGEAKADRYIRGGLLLNVYTGEIYPANIAIKGERIAYIGLREEMVGPRTDVIEAAGRTLVPGYIEPHAHPWNLATPSALARHVLPLGTTTIVGDNLTVYQLAGAGGFEAAVSAMARGPLKFFWMVRPHGNPARGAKPRASRCRRSGAFSPIPGSSRWERSRDGPTSGPGGPPCSSAWRWPPRRASASRATRRAPAPSG